jgi:CDP-glucose 4,6-dehydratase
MGYEAELHLRFPNAIRPWQFVLEPLSGYLEVAEKLFEEGENYAEPWNFAPGDAEAKPVGWLVEQIHRAWGQPAVWMPSEGPQPHEAIYLKLDASKAQARLGWRPRLTIDETVAWVVEWYRGVHEGADAEMTLARSGATGRAWRPRLPVLRHRSAGLRRPGSCRSWQRLRSTLNLPMTQTCLILAV